MLKSKNCNIYVLKKKIISIRKYWEGVDKLEVEFLEVYDMV